MDKIQLRAATERLAALPRTATDAERLEAFFGPPALAGVRRPAPRETAEEALRTLGEAYRAGFRMARGCRRTVRALRAGFFSGLAGPASAFTSSPSGGPA